MTYSSQDRANKSAMYPIFPSHVNGMKEMGSVGLSGPMPPKTFSSRSLREIEMATLHRLHQRGEEAFEELGKHVDFLMPITRALSHLSRISSLFAILDNFFVMYYTYHK